MLVAWFLYWRVFCAMCNNRKKVSPAPRTSH